MNIARLIALIKILLENKEEILELIELIKSIFQWKSLIGSPDAQDMNTVITAASYPKLSSALVGANVTWNDFISLIWENLDDIKQILSLVIELVSKFQK
jgi:hypothetical protein